MAIELSWTDSDERRRALPLLVDGARVGTVMVPRDIEPDVLEALQDRVLPSLETLVAAARKRDELEAQVIETKALRRSNVVKTAVLRSVSHDLRSPLTAITTAAAGLASDDALAEARAELTSVIELESDRLSRLVDNLLDLSKLQAGAVEPHADWCSVEELVRAAIESVREPPGGFDVQIDAGLPLLQRRRRRSSSGRSPTCSTTPPATRATSRSPCGRGPPPTSCCCASATAARASRARSSSASSSPSTRPGSGSGTGLGLAIARGFLEANGGRIRAESLPGPGHDDRAQPAGAGRAAGRGAPRRPNEPASSSATTRPRSCARCG